MLLEVKSNQKGYQKAKKQLFDGKARLEELLAAIGLKTTLWKYIEPKGCLKQNLPATCGS